MSVSVLEKAIDLCKEAAESTDYFGVKAYSDAEQTEAILFIYDMIQNRGEAKTIEWLYSEGFLQ